MADVLSVIADVLNQDKRQKKEQAKMMREVQKKLKEKGSEEVAEEPGDKEDYMKFFAGKLKKYGVKSPSELDDEKKKKFFNEIEKDWTHDSKEEVEVEKKEENLGKRVKARMEAEDEIEDEDEDPVGDSDEEEDTDVVKDGEPTEDELEKLADLVVQKIKDKADDEEEEEEEPDATEAESGKEEKIEVNPKMESVRNPHARATWEEALRQVYAVNEEKVELSEEVADILIRKGVGKMNKQQIAGKVMTNARKFGLDASVNGTNVRISGAIKKVNDYLNVIIGKSSSGDATQVTTTGYPNLDKQLTKDLKTAHGGIGPGLYREEVKMDEASDTSWIDPHAKKIESKWKSMNKSARKKWLQTMADMATDKKTKQAILDDVLDDFGLTEDYTDLRGGGDEGTTTSDTDKDYGLHQFSDPKYVPAYTDKSFQTAPDNTGIGQTPKPTQSGTPNKAVGKAVAAKKPAKIDSKGGMEKPAVGTKSDTPDKATGKATAAKISPEVTVKAGVSTAIHKEEVDKVLEYHRTHTEKRSVAFARKFYQKDKLHEILGFSKAEKEKAAANSERMKREADKRRADKAKEKEQKEREFDAKMAKARQSR